MRPIKRQPRAPKGGRQAMWSTLRKADAPVDIETLAEKSGAAITSVRGYLRILAQHDYVQSTAGGFLLLKDTGKAAPSVSVNEGTLHDWNLNPPMPAKELRAIWKASGLSMRQFCLALGLNGNHQTKLRAMMDGKKPASPEVERRATEFAAQS